LTKRNKNLIKPYFVLSGSFKRQWPPIISLLSDYSSINTSDSDNWTREDWKLYAEFLNESGITLLKELSKTQQTLRECKGKLSRKKKTPCYKKYKTQSLLESLLPPKKRGRKIAVDTVVIAEEAVQLQLGSETELTNDSALDLRNKLAGLSKYKMPKGRRRTIINKMGKIKKRFKITTKK